MLFEFNLKRTGAGEGGTLTWDSSAGTVAGELADEMESYLCSAEEKGYTTAHPYPTHYDMKDPRHDPDELREVFAPLIKPSPSAVTEDGLHRLF